MTGAPAVIVAAPGSGSGKTLVTLGLLAAFSARGVRVASCKVGPDYIDPAFHQAASGRPCFNLDGWCMRGETLGAIAWLAGGDAELLVVEGVMGLFDGSADGGGSTADLAAMTDWPVILVVDARGQAASAAALVHGFRTFRADVHVAGVVFNRVSSRRHEMLLRRGLAPLRLPVLGCLPPVPELVLPTRHLGLVQACEQPDLGVLLARAGDWAAGHIDLDGLAALARPSHLAPFHGLDPLPPLGQRLAVAQDAAFAFLYPHLLSAWRDRGAEITVFSPLADEAPDPAADAVLLPGGYPELHADRLAASQRFFGGLRAAAERGAVIYGECGGYMVLGEELADVSGRRHRMAGLLPLRTSYADRRLHLGYREMALMEGGPLGRRGARFRGHEFHYATICDEGPGQPLFRCRDAIGEELPPAGLQNGTVLGSFMHLIDRA